MGPYEYNIKNTQAPNLNGAIRGGAGGVTHDMMKKHQFFLENTGRPKHRGGVLCI